MVKEAERCMKCGFCMSVCPVYSVDHIEAHVARGRNVLVSMALKKKIPVLSYRDILYCCILCGRCLSVCPAKIPSVDIVIDARRRLIEEKGLTFAQYIIYRWLFFKRSMLASFIRLISYIPGISKKDASPLRHLAEISFMFSNQISIPKISKPFLSERLIKTKGKIAFFPGCAFEFIFPSTGERIFYSLKKLGLDVAYPYGAGCCGFPVYCAGDIETAKKIAKKNIELLKGYERIITGCATCATALKSYGKWIGEDEAKKLSSRVMGFSEFLIKEKIKIESSLSSNTDITYHDPCHMIWHQGIYDEPRKLISSIKGANLIEMEETGLCCGLGGSFGITHRKISVEIQKKKVELIEKTGSQIVATECPGCMIQLQEGLAKKGSLIKVVHIAELL